MGLSDFRRGPARLSRAAGWPSDRPPRWISRVACKFPLSRAIVLTPVEPPPPGGLGGSGMAFPFPTEGRLPRLTFSGPARRSLALWPDDSLSRPRRPFDIGGSRPFVTSRSTPIASWWSTSLPGVGLAPTGSHRPFTTHAGRVSDGPCPRAQIGDRQESFARDRRGLEMV
jgi:hypothetical protein